MYLCLTLRSGKTDCATTFVIRFYLVLKSSFFLKILSYKTVKMICLVKMFKYWILLNHIHVKGLE